MQGKLSPSKDHRIIGPLNRENTHGARRRGRSGKSINRESQTANGESGKAGNAKN